MRKGWAITQAVIATILQAYALLFIYLLSDYIYTNSMHFSTQGGIMVRQEVGFGELVRKFHVGYLLGLLALYGGIALLYDRKSGYIASLLATLLFTSFMLVSGRNGVISNDNIKFHSSIYYLLAAAGFAAMFILLLQKPFRQKYNPTLGNWLFIIAAVVLLVLDKAFIK